jgi:uncharacterized glyoxalase superfamily protein PhnB
MPDPFEALRMPVTPVDPDPAFAARLRSRVERALGLRLRGGHTMSTTTLEPETTTSVTPTGVVPYLGVSDARRALDWYVEALGARRRGEPIVMPDGRIGHAELELSGGILYLADEFPEIDFVAPRPDAGSSVRLTVVVPDVDAVTDRAVRAGAGLESPPRDEPYGRSASIRDPFGHRWTLQAAAQVGPANRLRHGDLAYVSLWVPDVERAAAFFDDVLGWTYSPDSDVQSRQVEGATPRHGLYGGQSQSTLFCCYVVDDLDAAIERVRAAGGDADQADERPYGRVAECTDPDRMRFALLESRNLGQRWPANGVRPGDVSYITMERRDSATARNFYGSVLGWRFTPGQVEDGWNVEDVVPMTGLWGGRDRNVVVPMYRVDDIDAAVERIRARGGTATEVLEEPYARVSECTDSQGTRFSLGQHSNVPQTSYIRHGIGTARPYLYGPLDLVDFVQLVFGAEELERVETARGGFHIETKIGDSVVVLETGESAPSGATRGSVYVYVDDVDAAHGRAVQAGATSLAEPEDKPYDERAAGFQDSFGNTWWIGSYRGRGQ